MQISTNLPLNPSPASAKRKLGRRRGEYQHPDAVVINHLGGPAVLSEELGYPTTQRVTNWMTRGIPSAVKVDRPDLFMPVLAISPEKHRTHAAWSVVNAPPARSFLPCMPLDDAFIMRACGWAALALLVMGLAGVLP